MIAQPISTRIGGSPNGLARIQVPDDCSLARLHGIIQAVMGWQDYHRTSLRLTRSGLG